MNLAVTNYHREQQKRKYTPAFKGPLDGALTGTLRLLDTNEMANAVLIDLGAMVAPRTYIDTKKRNKDAGFETFFREISGTFINCLSAGLIAAGISAVTAKRLQPEVAINHKSWFSDDSISLLKKAWDSSGGKVEDYIALILDNMSARDGKKVAAFKDIDWKNVEWADEKSWKNFWWNNTNYAKTAETLKSRDGIIKTFAAVIKDKNLDAGDKKYIFKIMEARITNALGANRSVDVNIGGNKLNSALSHILRDTYDMGKDVFTNKSINIDAAIAKIKRVNKIKIFGALSLASILGLTNQYINRKLTEKRTGKKGFVGDVDYQERKKPIQNRDKKGLLLKKFLASAGMVAMTIGVMRGKSPKDFIRKLQFTGPVSSGNAIKTVYASTIVGRFLAADSNTELRESVTRDYFGFLNWLVLGGFAAKGTANLLDKKQENLFNINKEGKGIKHWLNDITLKTHAEIAAKGKDFARKNIWKLNTAHIAGLAYSALALGVLLPVINIYMTNKKAKNKPHLTA